MNIDKESFLKKIRHTPFLLVYFSYPECQVCKVLKPKVQELLTIYPSFEFLYIDINKYPLFRGQFLVFTVPTIILFQKGHEMKRLSRHISLHDLGTYLDRLIQL